MRRRIPTTITQYTVALASIAAATWLRMLLDPLLGNDVPYATFFLAIMVTAWFGGIGSSAVALVLGFLSARYFFISPQNSFEVATPQHFAGLFLYLFVGISSLTLIQAHKTARRRTEASELDLQLLNADLERRIQERTEWLSERNAMLSAQQETSPDGILVVAPDGVFLSWNRRFAEMWGIPAEVLETRSGDLAIQSVLNKLVEPEIFVSNIHDLRVHLNGKSQGEIALRDGRTFDHYAAPMVGDGGKHYGRVWFFRDITDRKRIEEALRTSEARLRLIARSTNDLLWDWNLTTNELWWNENLQAALGYRAEEIEPGVESWINRLHPDDRETVVSGIHATIDSGRADWSSEYRFRFADGSYNHFLDRGFVIRDAQGKPIRMIGAMVNITERKQAEAKTARLERLAALGQLLGGIAHELKNPLFILTGNLQLLKSKLGPVNNDVAAGIRKLEEVTRRITLITQQFLALAMPTTTELERCSISSLLQSALDLVEPDMMRRIKVITTYAPGLPEVSSNPVQVREVFTNLIINAVQAMMEAHGHGTLTLNASLAASPRPRFSASGEQGEGARVTQSTGKEDNWIEVRIQDDGPGIPPEYRTKIFEPFFTTKSPDKGSGLGLWIVRSNLMMLRGTVQMDSEVGKGTTFIVRLPAAVASTVPSASVEAPITP